MSYEIIDFHMHPFTQPENNICSHKEYCNMSPENTVTYMKSLGISKICGSVLCRYQPEAGPYANDWEALAESNRLALELKERYGGFYVPGFHVHPGYVKESCEEIEKMNKLGIRLIGELTPYMHGWDDYACEAFDEILDVATQYNMIVSFHTMNEDSMDKMVQKHPDTVFVAAHPGEYQTAIRHFRRMKMSENYYLDLSGTGLFRHGMLRHGIDECGVERFLLGTDYPVGMPSMYLGGVIMDPLFSDEEKKLILAGNAKRLLKNSGML